MSEHQGPIDPGPDDQSSGGAGPPPSEPPPAEWPPAEWQPPGSPGQGQPGYEPPGYNYPQPEFPQPEYPQQGYPQHEHPQQGYPQPAYGQPAYGQPGYASYGTASPPGTASQNANIALGLSIGGLASYLVGFCCAPLALVGLVLCGVGLFMGYREVQAIDAGLADPAGKGTAKGAQIIGGIGVGLFVLGVVAVGALFGASAFL